MWTNPIGLISVKYRFHTTVALDLVRLNQLGSLFIENSQPTAHLHFSPAEMDGAHKFVDVEFHWAKKFGVYATSDNFYNNKA